MPAPTAQATNVVAELACPSCLSQSSFTLAVLAMATLTDDGVDDYHEPEWADDATITCSECQRQGTVEQFTVTAGDVLFTDDDIENIIERARTITYWTASTDWNPEDQTYTVHETTSPEIFADPSEAKVSVLTYAQLRRAFNRARELEALPDYVETQIEQGSIALEGRAADIVVQVAMFDQEQYV